MTTKAVAQILREAACAVPRVRWSRTAASVYIPETDDCAGTVISITGLHRPVARAYARHIAAASPSNVLALLEQRDELLDALEGLYEVAAIDDDKDYARVTNAAAVIAKARGAQ
ncbi:ead/Ea22-like family protein [Achromobacter ruhlandii]|uniref:ead/Ea22-like family protein n=1 Tax=Achromobacter ruhlandii TaxID=72557 RepID=UPI0021F154C1|nr:ead/Ea22-like family protein [Achromobacter ruhlandii]MCV6799341.1 ead/Ea22-like family protein [Achromobacter ruhlandii]MCV6805171.1 ead/Ea22-like family protein [Achromobacter ruhlandii]MCV6812807.1 ead/Ea22-like family protein [Achromobacter ruhlandii]MCV6821773.1 ead/Ea22-like family protein [Achromobacter ruhlandii]